MYMLGSPKGAKVPAASVQKAPQRATLQKTPGGYVGDRARKDGTLPSLSLTPRLLSLSKLFRATWPVYSTRWWDDATCWAS